MGNTSQTITENIFTHAIHLQELKKYKELKPTDNYLECDALFVDHDKKTFWLTKKETLEHTNKLINENTIKE